MGEYGELLAGAGIALYIVIALFLLVVFWWAYRTFRGKKGEVKKSDLPSDESFEGISEEIKGAAVKSKPILGSGGYKCLCFREIKGMLVADFTTMPEPIGELYQFDPSCPLSGNGYIVTQNDTGDIIDYDPREVKVETDETPEYAWHAINWKDDVTNFWTVARQWWKNIANWYAAAVLALVFFGILVVLG